MRYCALNASKTMLTIGGRIMLTIIVLFFCAYALLVVAACLVCETIDRQMKRDYPLDKPPSH